ncbi:unnamed protein product [Nesidiocoris tenuis]|uniref:RNA-directed DNA polymerase n=1 Tax=Nesidiocoris tenuis TaxID=355587 RepID=A0A6H5GEZ9_9HEMI|nr:unnamed protein product [Nesidiocoris tenuis]
MKVTLRAQDVATQFIEANAALKVIQADQKNLMLKGVFLAPDQEAAIAAAVSAAMQPVLLELRALSDQVSRISASFPHVLATVDAVESLQGDTLGQLLEVKGQLQQAGDNRGAALCELGNRLQSIQEELRGTPRPTPAHFQPSENPRSWPPLPDHLACTATPTPPPPPPPPTSFLPPFPQLGTTPNPPANDLPPPPPTSAGTLLPSTAPRGTLNLGKAMGSIAWYKGSPTPGATESWIAQIRNLKMFHEANGEHVPEKLWVQAAISRAEGEPALFLQRHQATLTTLNELSETLTRRFEGVRTNASYLSELQAATKAPQETVRQYAERLKSLAEKVDSGGNIEAFRDIALKAFIRGVPEVVKGALYSAKPASMSEAMNIAQSVMDMADCPQAPPNPAVACESTAALAQQGASNGDQTRPGPQPNRNPPWQPTQRKGYRHPGWVNPRLLPCTVCEELGHRTRDEEFKPARPQNEVPKRNKGRKVLKPPPPCKPSLEKGLPTGSYPSISSNPATLRPPQPITVYPVNSKPAFTLTGTVNGHRGTLLIDTGSAVTLVDRKAVNTYQIVPTLQRVKGVTGDYLRLYGETQCSLVLPDQQELSALAVVTDLPDGLLLLIGLDTQDKHGAWLDVRNRRIYLSPDHSSALTSWAAAWQPREHRTHAVNLVTTQVVVLPPNTLVKIPARRKGPFFEDGCLQTFQPYDLGQICFAQSIHSNTPTTHVLAYNLGPRFLTLHKNARLGYIDPTADYPDSPSYSATSNLASSTQSSFVIDQMTAPDAEQAFRQQLQQKLQHVPGAEQVVERLAQFHDVFSFPGYEKLGDTNLVEHTIPTGDHRPIRTKQYRTPFKQQAVIEEIVQGYLKDGVIQPGSGQWQSPCLLVPKRTLVDGVTHVSWRMVIDYRRVNAITTPEFYPLPHVQNCLDQMGGSKFFTSLDLRNSYHQIRVRAEDVEKTGFSTASGAWCFRKMPFGLSNAPATFQRMAMQIIRGLGSAHALAFLDDIILFHATAEEQITELCQLLHIFRQANLKLHLPKCQLLQSKVNYLGHVVSADGVQPDDRKLTAVRDFPVPSSVTKVKAFLGLCSYYRRFVKSFSQLAEPLNNLTKKDVQFVWGPKQQTAFDELKQRLTNPPILKYPDLSKEFVLSTDACTSGLGCVLSQYHDGVEHPVAYASRALNSAEKNYSATELELLAVVFGVKYFREYLWGTKFTIQTDHAPLRYLHQMKDTNSRLLRWSLALEEYTYTAKYKSGKAHGNADGLSRAFAATAIDAIDLAEILKEQKHDPFCIKMLPHPLYQLTDQDVVARKTQAGLRIVAPASLRTRILDLAHASPQAGHRGQRKTYQRVASKFYWPGMLRDVKEYVKACPKCALFKDCGQKKPPLGEFREPSEVFEAISIDIVGPLPQTPDGNKYILTILDQFSRFVQFHPMKTQTAEETAQKLLCHIGRFGTCARLLSDQGKNFTSELIRHFCEFFNIKKMQTTAYHPASNGRCERVHRSLGSILAHFVKDSQTDWDLKLPIAELVLNSHTNETTSFPPYTLVFGRAMRMPSRDELSLQPSIEPFALHVEELRAHLTSLWDAVKALQPQNKDTQRKFYDRSTEDPALQEGDLVYLHTPFLKKGKSKKLSKRWSGPYKIVRVINKQNVLLKVDRREVVTHTSRLKPVYHQEQPNNGDTPSDTDVASCSDSEPPSTNDQPSDRPPSPAAGAPTPPVSSNRTHPRYSLRPTRPVHYQ